MSESPDIAARMQRRLERERSARSQAEQLLEEKSGELYQVNQELEKLLSSQGLVLESYREAMSRLTHVLLSLSEDYEANVERIMDEGGRLLGAASGLVVRVDEQNGGILWKTEWQHSGEITEKVWQYGMGHRQIETWTDGETSYVSVPLEIRTRKVGVIILELARGKALDELGKMIAEFVGSGVAGEVERRETKREMKAKEERYESLFHASVDSILIIDFEGRVRDASESAVNMFGVQRGRLLLMEFMSLVEDHSRERVMNALKQVREAGRCHIEAQFLRSDGSTFPAEVVGSSVEIGGEKRIYAIARDITQQRKGQAAVRERERKFRTVFEQSLDGIVLHDMGGQILDVNETLCKLLGWTRAELTAKHLSELHPESARQTCRLAMAEVAERGRHRFECEFARKDGSAFVAEVWANSFELGGERVVQGIVRDVTEQRQKESEIREAMEAAELANESKSLFLTTMSHEIRTPLNGILGFADLLETSKMGENERNSVEMIRKSGDVLLGLINNILDFARAESGRITMKDEAFDPAKFLRNTVALHRGIAEGKALELQVEVSGEVPAQVLGSKAELRQVMMNLVGNAVKFTDEGKIVVSLKRVDGDKLRFSVADSGIGFPESDAEKLFEAFYQVDLSSTRRHGGTGLGLAICRRLVEAMGGEIRASVGPNGGAVFDVDLPLRLPEGPGHEAPAIAGESRPALDGHGMKVLVVEDHPVNSRLLKMMLEKWGFVVELAENGRLALDLLRDSDGIEVVLMDMRMPVMDGLEATQRLRAGEAGEKIKDLPVVAVTANALEADREACREVGMSHYLSKPISRRELERVMLEVITAI